MKSLLLLVMPFHILSFSDFKGKQTDSNYVAQTQSRIEINTDCTNGKCYFKVETFFVDDSSYMISDDPYILKHENGHLQIAEIETRKIRKLIKKYQGCKESDAIIVDNIYDSICDENSRLQQLYDKETNHSIDRQQQFIWTSWINKQLKNSK